MFRRFSLLRRSGNQVFASDPHGGAPLKQIPTGIVDLSASECQPVLVVIEPQAVVEHVSKKTLLRTLCGIAGATDTATVLASHIAGKREGRLIEKPLLVVVVLDLNAVVRVIAHTARRVQRILTQRVLISQHR